MGRNTNQSQFYITTVPAKRSDDLQANVAYLDKKLVAFGTVLEGMDVVYMIDKCGTAKGTPKWWGLRERLICSRVYIADSGELPMKSVNAPSTESTFIPPSLRE